MKMECANSSEQSKQEPPQNTPQECIRSWQQDNAFSWIRDVMEMSCHASGSKEEIPRVRQRVGDVSHDPSGLRSCSKEEIPRVRQRVGDVSHDPSGLRSCSKEEIPRVPVRQRVGDFSHDPSGLRSCSKPAVSTHMAQQSTKLVGATPTCPRVVDSSSAKSGLRAERSVPKSAVSTHKEKQSTHLADQRLVDSYNATSGLKAKSCVPVSAVSIQRAGVKQAPLTTKDSRRERNLPVGNILGGSRLEWRDLWQSETEKSCPGYAGHVRSVNAKPRMIPNEPLSEFVIHKAVRDIPVNKSGSQSDRGPFQLKEKIETSLSGAASTLNESASGNTCSAEQERSCQQDNAFSWIQDVMEMSCGFKEGNGVAVAEHQKYSSLDPSHTRGKGPTLCEEQGVTVVVSFDAKNFGNRPVMAHMEQTLGGKVKFKIGKIERMNYLLVVRVVLENEEDTETVLGLLKKSNSYMIKHYEIDRPFENGSDLNFELQSKSCPILEHHNARLRDEYEKLKSVLSSEAIIVVTKKESKKAMFERQNVEKKLMELTRQGNEFVDFMGCVSKRLIGREKVPNDEAALIRQSVAVECCRLNHHLPMYAKRRDIVKSVMSHQVTIILGQTGSGKSTQVVQYLHQVGFGNNGLITCTQPRKVAAVTLAKRVSEEMGTGIGKVVGHKSGGGRGKFSEETKVFYMTDYSLLTECIQDSELRNYSCVVIDEAHERSLYTDILLGMLKKLLKRRSRDLRLVISSATMDTELFRSYFSEFDPKVLEISGRTFPVEVIWPRRDWPGLSKYPVKDVVEEVKRIHKTEEKGDVLVFLTTPAETEKACESLSDRDLECWPLHGKLQPQEQQRVFQPAAVGKRKVVFATNCAETSITIPGIKYVVDTGLVKENKYDPIRNMSTLDVGKTSKSSVEQRKGRAGRIEAGKCFRLFTEDDYHKMDQSNKPEILRVQLGHAILSLMSAGITNVLDFDFVESPGVESLEAAMQDLVFLGAVENGSLTDLGRKISHLQLSPRLGKLVIEGVEQGVAMEALVVASICTLSGSIFFRMGTEEEKQKADIRKLPFTHNAGDLLTCLNVYRSWKDVDERQQNRWCVDKSINAKAMRIIEETLVELRRTLERDSGVVIDPTFAEDKEEADKKIQRAIFSCFKANLCRYGGHGRVGYLSCSEGGAQVGILHPSSTLRFSEPKWLVYDSILKTSQKFILTVTAVKDTWVKEMMEKGELDIDVSRMEENILVRTRMAEFGYMIMKRFTENRYALCNVLQKEMSEVLESPVIFDISLAPCVLDIIAKKDHHDFIKDVIRNTDAVAQGKEIMKAKEIQESLNETSTRIVFGNGYQVTLVLGEREYRSVVVKMTEDQYRNVSKDEILDYFANFGAIRDSFIFKNQKQRGGIGDQVPLYSWGKITFCNVHEAKSAVQQSDGKDVFAVPDLQQGSSKQGNNGEYLIRFKYCRRLSKGAGFVRFRHNDDAIFAQNMIGSFSLGNRTAQLSLDRGDPCKLQINNIDINVDENQLKRRLDEVINRNLMNYETIQEVVLFREKACDSKPCTPAEINAFKEDLKEATDGYVPQEKRNQYHIRIREVKPGHTYLFGTIHFRTLDVFEMVAACLPGGERCNLRGIDRPLEVTHHIKTSLAVPRAIYQKIEPCFREVSFILQQQMEVNVETCGEITRIHLSSEHARWHMQAMKLYQEIVRGDSITCQDISMELLFTADGDKELNRIIESSGAYIAVDKRMRTVSIHGTERARALAKKALGAILEQMRDNKQEIIPLQDGKQPRGLMKKVVVTYGCELQVLKEVPGVTEASIDLRRRQLKVRGDETALNTVRQRVADLAAKLAGDPNDEDDSDEIACSVCFVPFDTDYKNLYRLLVCGHAYCVECLKRQIDYSRDNKEYPIMCCGEDCTEPMTLQDIWKIFPKENEAVHKKHRMASLESFVSKNRQEYRFCPTPNCQGIYRVTTNENEIAEFRCEMCFCITCTCCHNQHPGLSCKDYKSVKDAEMVEKWRQMDPENRKFCPKCKIGIEKDRGCNHMECPACKTHFCWLCLTFFKTSGECYAHLREKHGAIADVADLVYN